MRRLRSPLAFLALSVLLHVVLLGAWLALGPEPTAPAPRPRPVVIEFEVREPHAAPPAARAEDTAGAQPPVRQPSIRRPRPDAPLAPLTPSPSDVPRVAQRTSPPDTSRAPQGSSPSDTTRAAQRPSVSGAPSTTDVPTSAPLATDVPRRDGAHKDAPLTADVPLRDGARQDTWLLPSSVPSRDTDAAQSALDEGLAEAGPPSPADVARGAVTEGMARARRASGLVHAYYGVLGEALLGAWAPQARVRAEADFLSRGNATPQPTALNAWLKNAQRYGRTGSPMEEAPAKVRRAPSAGPLDQETVERSTGSYVALKAEADKGLEAGRRARVLVVQTCAGPLRQARLLQPSQRPSADAALMADLRRVGDGLPRPPTELCREDAVGSVWDFALVGAGELVRNPSGVLLRTQRLEGTRLAKLVHFVESR